MLTRQLRRWRVNYRDEGNRPRHQVGILDKNEMLAEERICNLFAQKLLVPTGRLRDFFEKVPVESPWSLLRLLERTARNFQVTIPLLMMGLNEIRLSGPPYIILLFSYKENRYKGSDPRLRVYVHSTLGDARKRFWVWRNRSAEGINMKSVVALFTSWKNRIQDNGSNEQEPERGGRRYTWDPYAGLVEIDPKSVPNVSEKVNVTILSGGKWTNESIPMTSVNCLYMSPNATERDVHILSVLTPSRQENHYC